MAKKPKARTGRPSSYKPEYAEALIKHMGAGYSFESFAAVVGRNRDTMYEWVKQYPDFSDAKKKGTDLALLYWESLGLLGASGKQKGFNVVAWIFNMKNRFGWRNMDPNEEKKPEQSEALRQAMQALEEEEAPQKPKQAPKRPK